MFVICWKSSWKGGICKFESIDFFPIYVVKFLLHWGQKEILIPNGFSLLEKDFLFICEETSVMNLWGGDFVVKQPSDKKRCRIGFLVNLPGWKLWIWFIELFGILFVSHAKAKFYWFLAIFAFYQNNTF